jgi:hypothetical protein
MKAYGGLDVYIHVFLISAVVGGKWSVSRPGRFTPGDKFPDAHRKRGWVGPKTGLDDVGKRKFLTLPGLELRSLVVQPVANRYTDCAIPVPLLKCIYIYTHTHTKFEMLSRNVS